MRKYRQKHTHTRIYIYIKSQLKYTQILGHRIIDPMPESYKEFLPSFFGQLSPWLRASNEKTRSPNKVLL